MSDLILLAEQRAGLRGAIFSPCGQYRYRLWRPALPGVSRRVCFLLLNPSQATDVKDDNTVKRCIGFARDWGFGVLDIVNPFAWISTNPDALLTVTDPIGPDNDNHIAAAFDGAELIVCGWGQHVAARRRLADIQRLAHGRTLMCLGTNADGSPCHPLFLKKTTPLVPFAA